MSLLFRFAVFIPVLYLIAVVVVGQQHTTAQEVLQAAGKRTIRWVGWAAVLLLCMTAADLLIIGW
ncbi:MAG: O-antigen ligase [Planctomycetota bacterium]|jgi:O-antigen ligase